MNKKRRRADFGPFAASFFAPYLFRGDFRSRLGCGASALALITGVAPEIIASLNQDVHYSDRFITQFLRERDFQTMKLTPKLVVSAKTKIGPEHVILVSQLFRRGEGTWGVVFGDFFYHNFEAYSLSSLAFVNQPLLSAYLVMHSQWRVSQVVHTPAPKPRPKRRLLRLRTLRRNFASATLRRWA